MIPTHALVTEYADPVLRPASPASSLGTAYGPDQTSLSDSELSGTSFEKKCLARLELDQPRKDEVEANEDPLITIQNPSGKFMWVGDDEGIKDVDPVILQVLSDSIVVSLNSEINRLREDDLYEQTLLKGSKAGLEPQPSTNDIDSLMRGMMGPSMDIGSQPYMGRNSLLEPQRGRTTGAGIVDGPWNNFGQPHVGSTFDRRDSFMASTGTAGGKTLQSPTTSTSTIGKRTRNGASKVPRKR